MATCRPACGAWRRDIPRFDDALAKPVDLEQRVNLCRTRHQQAQPFANESREQLALTALIGRQSRGMTIESGSARLEPFVSKGREIFMRRQGQLNLACANCHDDNWDKHLAGSAITQAHPTGYPLYRLEWQSLGSLQRRLRNCMVGMRAQPYDADAPETVELKLYLMSRARGWRLRRRPCGRRAAQPVVEDNDRYRPFHCGARFSEKAFGPSM